MTESLERRIILVGKTGNGKSSTGNSLLGKEVFLHKLSANAVTKKCQKVCGTSNYLHYTIVDTPGLFDTEKHVLHRALEIQSSLEICKTPHAFLIIFSATGRMTQDEAYTIDMLRIIFGEKVIEHMIVVFTNGNQIETDEKFKEFWQENEVFKKLIESCGGRVFKIENKKPGDTDDVKRVLKAIEDLSKHGTTHYTYDHIEEHRKAIEECARTLGRDEGISAQVEKVVKKLGERLPINIWKPIVIGTALIGTGVGVGVVAAGGSIIAVGSSMIGGVGDAGVAVGGAIASSPVGNFFITYGGAAISKGWSVASRLKFW